MAEALIIRSVLASSSIPSVIEEEHASMFGYPTDPTGVTVKVEKSRRDEAEEALDFKGVEGVDFGWDLGEEGEGSETETP
jgi:hypothetical protein